MKFEIVPDGTATTPLGFTAGAVACGVKASGKPDLAVIYSQRECTAAGMFTKNQVAAAPVILDRQTLANNNSHIRGVVTNSGNANACTGREGLLAAGDMQRSAATLLGTRQEQIFVLSTGIIGVPLPVDKIKDGLKSMDGQLSAANGLLAARAIMTTDKRPKHLAVRVPIPHSSGADHQSAEAIFIGGMAKGSGMIHPNMATMLAVITTDAAVPARHLQEMLSRAVDKSFNRISVDGDGSTNDTVLLLANSASGVAIDSDDWPNDNLAGAFAAGLDYVCMQLAKMIVADGEGASKFVEIQVSGVARTEEAHAVASTVATSPLVKTALAGSDPNWGRILAAAGRAGVPFDQNKVALSVSNPDEVELGLVVGGVPTDFAEKEAAAIFARPEINIYLDLGQGDAQSTVWTCDLTHDYVTINQDYRT